jgi:hypothetical protein
MLVMFPPVIGGRSTLTISGLVTIPLGIIPPLTLVEASDKASDGTVSPVNGIVDAADSQHLLLTINFPGNSQPFQPYKFSWEQDNAAGTTQWGGSTARRPAFELLCCQAPTGRRSRRSR